MKDTKETFGSSKKSSNVGFYPQLCIPLECALKRLHIATFQATLEFDSCNFGYSDILKERKGNMELRGYIYPSSVNCRNVTKGSPCTVLFGHRILTRFGSYVYVYMRR